MIRCTSVATLLRYAQQHVVSNLALVCISVMPTNTCPHYYRGLQQVHHMAMFISHGHSYHGGHDKMTASLGVLESRGRPLSAGKSESISIVEPGKPPLPEVRFIPFHVYFYYMVGHYKMTALLGVLALPLLVEESESTPIIEVVKPPVVRFIPFLVYFYYMGGDEKMEAVIIEADAGGSPTTDAASSPSVAHGQLPIHQVLFNPYATHLPYMLT
ncbi:hypothetical protein Cgig2_008921 [Carnegiea gigantea]|uniref:Uncharacterized protein n=1 Tax=Carnegiea gigantea TaxID=171969 RepID=A0A9Q1GVZ2_9CARY|nr:hypothetical protein Cgig2_008921 [Carnegiea gigantea]